MSDSVRESAVPGANAGGAPRCRRRFGRASPDRREAPWDDRFTSGGRPVVDITDLGEAARRRLGPIPARRRTDRDRDRHGDVRRAPTRPREPRGDDAGRYRPSLTAVVSRRGRREPPRTRAARGAAGGGSGPARGARDRRHPQADVHDAVFKPVGFEDRYREHLRTDADARVALAALRERVRDGEDLALVCFEADDRRCRCHVLREVLLEGV